jgi:serine/threonine protein kinase
MSAIPQKNKQPIVSMSPSVEIDPANLDLEFAKRWCAHRGDSWAVSAIGNSGGTARVFKVTDGAKIFALKILNSKLSTQEIEENRIALQCKLGVHACQHMIQTFDGGKFENRLFLLTNWAEGSELEKVLTKIPRNRIKGIIHQIATACIFLREHGLCHRDIKPANIFISDDFERVTLLDLSVFRDIYDPVGLGTDQNGELPVVATSRYCSPEYLFRLASPNEELWHALDIYQLGALIHDLVMQKPMFEDDYRISNSNRYRFAWIVATQVVELHASDVDQDLIFLGKRALDKNWKNRARLQLTDFLDTPESREQNGLSALGLGVTERIRAVSKNLTPHVVLDSLANEIKDKLREKIKNLGMTPIHKVLPGKNDLEKKVQMSWDPANGSLEDVLLLVSITMTEALGNQGYEIQLELNAKMNGAYVTDSIYLPLILASDGISTEIALASFEGLKVLSQKIIKPKS